MLAAVQLIWYVNADFPVPREDGHAVVDAILRAAQGPAHLPLLNRPLLPATIVLQPTAGAHLPGIYAHRITHIALASNRHASSLTKYAVLRDNWAAYLTALYLVSDTLRRQSTSRSPSQERSGGFLSMHAKPVPRGVLSSVREDSEEKSQQMMLAPQDSRVRIDTRLI